MLHKEAIAVRCKACGIEHENPAVLHTFNTCKHCGVVMEAPSAFQQQWAQADLDRPLTVLFAIYGHPNEPRLALDVKQAVQRLVDETPQASALLCYMTGAITDATPLLVQKDSLIFRENTDLLRVLLGVPTQSISMPCTRMLVVRYRTVEHFARITIEDNGYGKIDQRIALRVPAQSRLHIRRAIYGHPRGVQRGGQAYDVGAPAVHSGVRR
jgi:hypothetical protein